MESGKVTMKSLILIVFLTSLAITRTRSSLLGVELDETGEEFLNEYLSLDESRYLAELQEFQDGAIEIDLIDSKKHRTPHQEPRVLYQIGVSLFYFVIYFDPNFSYDEAIPNFCL